MKRIYSLILLLSFGLGAIQPVMPMMEYVVAEGRFADLFQSKGAMACPVADMDMDKICLACDCCDTERGDQESLLDTDYYPIPLQIVPFSGDHALTVASEMYSLADEQTLMHYYTTSPPPPRHA